MTRRVLFAAFAAAAGLAQQSPPAHREDRLPDGRTRSIVILKDDHKKSRKDIAEIRELARELEDAIENGSPYAVDIQSVKKAERIEKLAKNIKNRLKRIQ